MAVLEKENSMSRYPYLRYRIQLRLWNEREVDAYSKQRRRYLANHGPGMCPSNVLGPWVRVHRKVLAWSSYSYEIRNSRAIVAILAGPPYVFTQYSLKVRDEGSPMRRSAPVTLLRFSTRSGLVLNAFRNQ